MTSGKRNARIEITSSAAGVDRGVNDARKKMRAFAREQERSAKHAEREAKKSRSRAAAGLAGGIGTAASVAAGMAGFDIGRGMLEGIIDTGRELTRFQIDAQLSTAQVGQFNEQLLRTSSATGVSRKSLVETAHAYQILTGDAAGAVKNTELMAKVMNATGASGQDVAGAMATLNNMKLDPANYQKAMDIMIYMGHKGAVELRDVAGQVGTLQPMFNMFAGGGTLRGIAEMNAAMQVGRKGFGSADEMATGFQSAMSQMISGPVVEKLKKFGVQVYSVDPKTKKKIVRDYMDIAKDLHNSKLSGDIPALRGIFTNIRAFKFMNQIVSRYEEMAELAQGAEGSDQTNKDNLTWMNSTSGKLAQSWEIIKNSIASALTPERVEMFANGMMRAAKFAAEFVSWLNGPDAHDKKMTGAGAFLDRANAGDEAGAVRKAKAIASMTREEWEKTPQGMLTKYSDTDLYGGAQEFLKSNSGVIRDWWDRGGSDQSKLGSVDSAALGKQLAQDIGAEIAKLNIHVNLDGKLVGEGVDNNIRHAKGMGKR